MSKGMESNINQTLKLGSHIQNPRWICILVIKLLKYDKLKNRADGNNGQVCSRLHSLKGWVTDNESVINAPEACPLIIFTDQFKQRKYCITKNSKN